MKSKLALVSSIAFALLAGEAHAVTLRYALVVGNNLGVDPEAGTLPTLLHAEREAMRLHATLIKRASFDPAPARTALLVRPTRAEVMRAVEAIAAQMNSDRVLYGEVETLFAFFFTGHGLQGRLLLADGALERAELAAIFKRLEPDLTVGMVDACFSGSIGPETLLAKGVRGTPGINALRDLPEETLNAEGSVWFVSSGPGEASYEDRELGGVFTHFFIRGLEGAAGDGPVITLDQIWRYVQSNTVAYTAARTRPQKPQQIVAKMRASGPLYFSFRGARDAKLVLSDARPSRLVLSYADGFNEIIEKGAGEEKEIAVYSGTADLTLITGERDQTKERVVFQPGGRVVIAGGGSDPRAPAVGNRLDELWSKGAGQEQVRALAIAPAVSVLAGVSYEAGGGIGRKLAPLNAASAIARLDHGPLVLGVSVGYATDSERFTTWGYRVHELRGELRGGLGWDLGDIRIAALAAAGIGVLEQRYDDGVSREGFELRAGPVLDMLHRLTDHVAIDVALRASLIHGPGAGIRSEAHTSASWGASLGVLFDVW